MNAHFSNDADQKTLPQANVRGQKATKVFLGASLVALVLLNVAIFAPHWRGRSSFTFDFPQTYYASTAYWIASVQGREWPQWVPYQSMGYPIAMNPQVGLFYPPFWLFVLLRQQYTLYAANIVQILHIFAGAIGMFLLTRRLFRSPHAAVVAALAFQFYGGFFTNAQHPDFIRGFALTPWLFWTLVLDPEDAGRPTRLDRRLLLVPFLVFLFVTGAYLGVVMSTFAAAGIFIVCQAVIAEGAWKKRAADVLLQLAMIGIGIGLAGAMLVPFFALQNELARVSARAAALGRRFLVFQDFIALLIPAGFAKDMDLSMVGMQIPMILPVLLAFVRRKDLSRLVPFFVVGVFAAVMSIDSLVPLAKIVNTVFPPFTMSRFPSGDFRLLLVLPLFIAGIAGIANLLNGERRGRATALAAAILLLVVYWCLQVRLVAPIHRQSFVNFTVLSGICVVISLIVAYFSSRRIVTTTVFAVVSVVLLVPGAKSVSVYWDDPKAEHRIYDWQGVSLKEHGHLRVYDIFARHLMMRPARKPAVALANEGYVDGSFMMKDRGNATSIARATIERNPALLQLMLQPTTLLPFDCARVACTSDQAQIPLAQPKAAGVNAAPLSYARNSVSYNVTTSRPILLVENEAYAPGWSAHDQVSGEKFRLVRVDGALRGWVIPPGTHVVILRYWTPGLSAGVLLSAIAMLVYAAIAFVSIRRRLLSYA